MIPIRILEKDKDVRALDTEVLGTADGMYYVIAENGLFLRKVNKLYASTQKPAKLSGAGGELNEFCHMYFKPVPRMMVLEMTAFCKAIYNQHKAEAVCIGFYNPEAETWSWDVPEQETTPNGLSVDYSELPPAPTGSVPFLSFHSHCAASAFQSGTDHKDEHNFDGIHITVGKLDTESPEYHHRFVAGGSTWKVDDLSLLVAPEVRPSVEVNAQLLARVKPRRSTSAFKRPFGYAESFDEVVPPPNVEPPKEVHRNGVYDSASGNRVSPMSAKNTDIYAPGEDIWYAGEYFVKISAKHENGWKLLTKTFRGEVHAAWNKLQHWEREEILDAIKTEDLRRCLAANVRQDTIAKMVARNKSKAKASVTETKSPGPVGGMSEEDWKRWESGQWGGD